MIKFLAHKTVDLPGTKIIVGGSMNMTDYKFLKRKMCRITRKLKRVNVLSSGQFKRFGSDHEEVCGAARLGEQWAASQYYVYSVYAAHGMDKYDDMAAVAKFAVIFYKEGKKKDDETKRLIRACNKAKVPIREVLY